MCGIFGLVLTKKLSDQNADDVRSLVKEIFILSQQRGQDASGLAVFDSHAQVSTLKKALAPKKIIKTTEYKNIVDSLIREINDGCGVFGHARMVTSGDATKDKNNHPLQQGGLTLIHNGIICNTEELLEITAQKYPVETDVDTEALLARIRWEKEVEQKSFQDAVVAAFSVIEGTASVCVFDEAEKSLIISSNNGSLYFSYNAQKGALIFASERYILEKALERNPAFQTVFSNVENLLPNTGKKLNLQDSDLQTFTMSYGLGNFPVRRYDFDRAGILHTIQKENILWYDEEKLLGLKRCTTCLLPETYPFIEYDDDGECNYCKNMTPTVVEGQNRDSLQKIIERFIERHGNATNCVIPLSGGRDSCYGSYVLAKEFGVKPITYTYDWGMVTDLSRRNVARTCGALELENILVSANIRQKLDFIKMNVSAWLKKPDLGLIPLFMAGDKHFFSWVNTIKKQNGLDLNIWMMSPLENADFKEGFSGVQPHWKRERTDFLSPWAKIKMLAYYGGAFLKNPAYINRSIPDTATGFFSFYMEPRTDYHNLFDFIDWDEKDVHDVIYNKLGWENSADSPNSWRVGDGTAPFYNYIYTTVAGFSENDTFRSNQIRNGTITREEGLKLVMEENIPRREGLLWYFDRIGLDYEDSIRQINIIPKLHECLVS